MIDALGNEVIEGNWYGYSKQDSGITTVVFAKVKYIKDGKARRQMLFRTGVMLENLLMMVIIYLIVL